MNPIQVNVKSIENLYIDPKRAEKTEPLMVRYDLLGDGHFVESRRQTTARDMALDYRHVFLFGLRKQLGLEETLASRSLEIYVHDRDEVILDSVVKEVEYLELKEAETVEEVIDPKTKKKVPAGAAAAKKPEQPAKKKEDPKKDVKKKKEKKKDYTLEEFQQIPKQEYFQREFGVATFFMKDLLNPFNQHYKLQAPICPRRVFVDDDRDNLNLNQTARKKGRDIVKATDYFGEVSLINTEFLFERRGRLELPSRSIHTSRASQGRHAGQS